MDWGGCMICCGEEKGEHKSETVDVSVSLRCPPSPVFMSSR